MVKDLKSLESAPEISELLQRAIETGNPIVLNQFWSIISDRLMALTRRMLRNYPRLQRWEESDDVYQTAVLRLQKSILEVKPDSAARFWGLAMTQLRRTLIDLSRHHFRNNGYAANHESGSDLGLTIIAQAEDSLNDPTEPLTLEQWSEFHMAVERLPEDEREVFQLTWYAGLTQPQAAATLGVSIPTIQRRLYRARLCLHDSLAEINQKIDAAKP